MKKILIFGGAGFIGANLVRKLLLDRDNKIIVVDNFYSGKKSNLENIDQSANLEIIDHDICKPINIIADEIYNLACPASPPHYQSDPIQTTKISIFGTLNALELANKNNCKILQASTSEVYGDPLQHPQVEEYWGNVNPIGIRSCYDEGKRCAESFCMDFHRQHRTKIKICRIFNTYGPYMRPDDGRVVSNFIIQALQNKDITIYGDGNQTRSFCFISDLVNGLISMMHSSDEIIGPVNLGNDKEFTIKKLAENIILKLKSSSKINNLELPGDDPKIRKPNISKAKLLLGWQPQIDLDDGLDITIKYFKSII